MNEETSIEKEYKGLEPDDFLPKSLKNWIRKKYFHWLEMRCQKRIKLAISNGQISVSGNATLEQNFQNKINLFIKSMFDIYMCLFDNGYVWLGVNQFGNFVYDEKETKECNLYFEDDYFTRKNLTKKQVIKSLYDDFDNVCSADSDIINERGVLGALSPDIKGDRPIMPMEQERFQNFIQKTFGLVRKKWKIWIADQPVRYTKIDLPIEQLQLSQRKIQLKIDIGEVYGIPVELMPKDYSAKFDNLDVSIQMFYQDEVAPFIMLVIEQLLKLPEYVLIDISTITVDFPNVQAVQKTKQVEFSTKKMQIDTEIQLMDKGLQTPEETKLKIQKIQNS
jgi:hypothetical protein